MRPHTRTRAHAPNMVGWPLMVVAGHVAGGVDADKVSATHGYKLAIVM